MKIEVQKQIVQHNLKLLESLKEGGALFVDKKTGRLSGSLRKGEGHLRKVSLDWDQEKLKFKVTATLDRQAKQALAATGREALRVLQNKSSIFDDPAYHRDLSREEAEKLLLGKKKGSYLLRRDEYAKMLQDQLEEPSPLCFTVTFLGEDDGVIDRTIVQKNGKFQIYNDDPTLRNRSYSNFEVLLKDLKCTYPLFR